MATNMTFTDFVTPVPADWLNNVNTWVNFIQARFILQTTNASGQSIPSGVNTLITNWSGSPSNGFNPTTGVFTPTTSGTYRVQAQLTYNSASFIVGNIVDIFIVVNGVTKAMSGLQIANAAQTQPCIQIEYIAALTAGQTLGIYTFQNTGVSIPLAANSTQNLLSLERLS